MSNRIKMAQVVREQVREYAGELRVCMPARVVTYDADTYAASVQPLLRRRFYRAPRAVLLPIINGVPVTHPRTKSALIRLPVAAGDIVTLVFADRSLEAWLAGDGADVDPADTRQHHLSDAYAILGGYPRGDPSPAQNPDALEIVVEPGTKVTIGNGTDELLQLASDAFGNLKSLCDELSQTLSDIQSLTVSGVTTGGGVSGVPVNAAAFATLKTNVDTISTAVQGQVDALGNLKI